jgi:hypothetical protein
MSHRIRDRYPAPWRVEPIPAPGYRVVSANGVAMAYVYAGRKGLPDPQLTEAEALAVAQAIASLANADSPRDE